MQLDIFDHSRDTMLRNDVVHAIERREAGAARPALTKFSEEFSHDESLPPLAVLVDVLERRVDTTFADHDALRHARLELRQVIEPAALRMLGDQAAAAWLSRSRRDLAQRAAQLAFLPARSEDHSAPIWLLGASTQPRSRP